MIHPFNHTEKKTPARVEILQSDIRKMKITMALRGLVIGTALMGAVVYYLVVRYEVAPRIPALTYAWTHYEAMQYPEVRSELVVEVKK